MPRSDWVREPQLLSLRVWSLCSAREVASPVETMGTVDTKKSGTHFSLDSSVVMETSPLMKNSLGLQPASQTAFRILLLHHLVHLLGNADHLVLHGPGRPAPRRAARDGKRAELVGRRVSPGVGEGPQQA